MRISVASAARVCAALLVACLIPTGVAAQEPTEEDLRRQIQESQARLQTIRAERRDLQDELQGLSGQVHDVNEELVNIERQIAASASLLAEMDIQLAALEEQASITTREMLLTRDRLTARKVVLRRRLREIYKRGPARPVQVLLSATSFGDLMNRYKYLYRVARFDRALVDRVERLERDLEVHRDDLGQETERIGRLRTDKARELDELERLEQQRQQRLRSFASRRTEVESRLTQLAAEEAERRRTLSTLEERRRERERTTGEASVSTITTADVGRLAWPVDGPILYGFGAERRDGTTTMRQGVGIGAPPGSPARAVAGGDVAFVGLRGVAGYTVMIHHGGGYYSVYLYLQTASVLEGQRIEAGQVIGLTGGSSTEDGPHLEFQIWEPTANDPRAVDPITWLRTRGP